MDQIRELRSLMGRLEVLFQYRVVYIEERSLRVEGDPDPKDGARIYKYSGVGKTEGEAELALESKLGKLFRTFPTWEDDLTLVVRTTPHIESIRNGVFWDNKDEGDLYIASFRFALVKLEIKEVPDISAGATKECEEIEGLTIETNKVGRTSVRFTGS